MTSDLRRSRRANFLNREARMRVDQDPTRRRFGLAKISTPQAHLKQDAAFGSLVDQLDRMQDLQRLLETTLPTELATKTRAVALQRGELLLMVADAAAATALKPRIPQLIRSLNQINAKHVNQLTPKQLRPPTLDILEIRVQVRVETVMKALKEKNLAKPLGPAPPWQAIAQQLEDSPLKAALERLASESRTHRRRQT
jgi:hypothetical protein